MCFHFGPFSKAKIKCEIAIAETSYVSVDRNTGVVSLVPVDGVSPAPNISLPAFPRAKLSGSALAFSLDKHTIALGQGDGKYFDKFTLGDNAWTDMADSPQISRYATSVCDFNPIFVTVGSGE